jgi:tetratricopeptide (TPR) repeat protein
MPRSEGCPLAFLSDLRLKVIFLAATICSHGFGAQSLSASVTEGDRKALFAQGQQDLIEHRDEAAFEVFQKLLAGGMISAPVYSNIGIACLRTGRKEEAIANLQKAQRLAPDMPGINLNLGLAYYKKQDFPNASASFSSHLAKDPDNNQARYLRALCSYFMDNYGSAANDLLSLQGAQSSIDYFFILGISLGHMKRREESERAFSKMIEVSGNTPEMHLLLAQAYLGLHDNERAEAEVGAVMSTKPQTAFAHYYRGIIHELRGQKTEALADYEAEIRISPHEAWSFEHAGNIRLEQGDAQGAADLLEAGLAQNPHTPRLLMALAKAYLHLDEPQKATPMLENAVALEPQNGSFHYQLGRAYKKLGRARESEIEMRLAARLFKDVDSKQVLSFSEEQSLKQMPSNRIAEP